MNKSKVNDENHINMNASVINREEFKSNITHIKSQPTKITKSKAKRYNANAFSIEFKKAGIMR